MRIVCIYTQQRQDSTTIAKRCVESGKKFDYEVELFPGVYWKDLDKVHKELNLKQKYKPLDNIRQSNGVTCPASYMANGTTHYILYKWSVDNNEPICILEHDAIFVGEIPEAIPDGVIQISSHQSQQSGKDYWLNCNRARKTRKYQPDFKIEWDDTQGVIKHPLAGTNGTSGYIIHPNAAQKMIDYINEDGIAYADRIRTERIGEGNLYLQVPQSIICDHKVKSTYPEKK
jgi:hypothetical protein